MRAVIQKARTFVYYDKKELLWVAFSYLALLIYLYFECINTEGNKQYYFLFYVSVLFPVVWKTPVLSSLYICTSAVVYILAYSQHADMGEKLIVPVTAVNFLLLQ